MKRHLIASLLISFFSIPLAHAETVYLGALYGQVETDNATTDNVGIVIGGSQDPGSGFGVEFFYALTANDDSDTVSGQKINVSISTYGLFGVYKTASMPYVKGEIGVAVVDVTLDIKGSEDRSDSESGFAYGVAVGAPVGNGNLELSYRVLPSINNFDGTDVDTDVDMIAISYLWNF